MGRINSKQKGKRGELELAEWLRDNWGAEARRGQQFKGTPDSPDISFPEMPFHFECKRTESISLYAAYEQARADAGDRIPVVAHRRSRKPWLFILSADDVVRFAEILTNWRANLEVDDLETEHRRLE